MRVRGGVIGQSGHGHRLGLEAAKLVGKSPEPDRDLDVRSPPILAVSLGRIRLSDRPPSSPTALEPKLPGLVSDKPPHPIVSRDGARYRAGIVCPPTPAEGLDSRFIEGNPRPGNKGTEGTEGTGYKGTVSKGG